jgi:HSP20 family protein
VRIRAQRTLAVEKNPLVPIFPANRVELQTFVFGLPTKFCEENTMTVVRYEPWALVSRLQKDVDRLFSAPQATAADSGAWLPQADIHEDANQFLLNVDLPGVDPKAVEITADHGVLTIRGQREEPGREACEARRIERVAGEFRRRFNLPDSADTQNITAKAVNGVLEVSIPKLAKVPPHRITVEAA